MIHEHACVHVYVCICACACACVSVNVLKCACLLPSKILELKKDYNDKLFTLRDKKIEVIAKVGSISYYACINGDKTTQVLAS